MMSRNCPPGFRLYQPEGVQACQEVLIRTCGSQSGSCQSVKFPSYNNYSQLCGWVVGYQYISPDAIDHDIVTGHDDINSHYVDGMNTK